MITSLFGASFDRRVGSKFVSQGKYLPTSIRAKLLYAKPMPWSGDWEAPSGDWEAVTGDTDYSAHKLPGKTDPSYAAIYAAVNDGSGFWYDSNGDPVAHLVSEILAEIRTNTWNIWCNSRGRLMVFSKALLYSEAAVVERYILGSRPATNAPPTTSDVVLHYDAEKAELAELTGGASPLNHSVLSPQYERQPDGSYVNVGARPAVDMLEDGFVGLRSCGQVQNLIPNSEAVGGAVGVLPTGWIKNESNGVTVSIVGSGIGYVDVRFYGTVVVGANYSYIGIHPVLSVSALVGETLTSTINNTIIGGSLPTNGVVITAIERTSAGAYLAESTVSISASTITRTLTNSSVAYITTSIKLNGTPVGTVVDFTIRISRPQLTKTAYPQPYVPTTGTSVTQPSSNATTTNGTWFANPLDSDLWKSLTGSPLTLATRIKMGVGSGDINSSVSLCHYGSNTSALFILYTYKNSSGATRLVGSDDGTSTIAYGIGSTWSRFDIFKLYLQINTAGTRRRAGYMIEGIHSTIQWSHTGDSSTWAVFDGSFDPSTIYRLMYGCNNPSPMWLNKLTVWKRQVPDDELAVAWL